MMKKGGLSRLSIGKIARLTDEQLGQKVGRSLAAYADWGEDLVKACKELRQRFHKKPRATMICGCRTWEDYCTKYFERTRRAVDYFLSGGNPVSNRSKPAEEPQPAEAPPTVSLTVRTTTERHAAFGFPKESTPINIISVPMTPEPPQHYFDVTVHEEQKETKEETVASFLTVQDVARTFIEASRDACRWYRQRVDEKDYAEFDRLVAQGLAEEFNYFSPPEPRTDRKAKAKTAG